jgi:hypothetical protein
MKQDRIAQDRRNIFEYDTFLWKVGHITYGPAEFFQYI